MVNPPGSIPVLQNITWNLDLKGLYKEEDVLLNEIGRLRWVGYVARTGQEEIPAKVCKYEEGERPRLRWEGWLYRSPCIPT